MKNTKNGKNGKSSKSQKCKIIKSVKTQNQKSDKKSVKKWPTPKMPKMSLKWPKSTLCEIRAAWLGTFSIPGGTTGPDFKAEINMGGVRRRIFDTFFCFQLLHFVDFCVFPFSWFCHFFTFSHFLTFDDFTFLMIFSQILCMTSFLINFCH